MTEKGKGGSASTGEARIVSDAGVPRRAVLLSGQQML